ncbi:MAG: type II secretion system F family protein [Acidimicrobiia bacterium]
MEWLIVLGTAGAVLLLALYALTAVTNRAEARQSLARIDGYQVEGAHVPVSTPLLDRTVEPMKQRLTEAARKHSPAGYAQKVAHKLTHAGSPKRLDVDQFLVLKLLGTVSGPLWFVLVFGGLGMSGGIAIMLTGLLWLIAFMLPDVTVTRRVDARQQAIRKQLPEFLDLLTISVQAGLGFDQAVERTSASVPGPLSDEFQRMLREMRIGSSRAEALRGLEARTDIGELRSFVLAMLQADTFGVSISRILQTQADEMRVRRRQRAQELGQKAPVKMLPPLVFCIFPAFFVVILGPAAIRIFQVL